MPLGQAQGHGMRQLAPGSGPGWAAPENSGIRRFAGDYRLYDADEEDQEFYEWMGTSPWKNCRSIPASSGQ